MNDTATIQVYDNPTTGETIRLKQLADGNWYGWDNNMDFYRATKESAMHTLNKWGYTQLVGEEQHK